jgi:pimeloyl-ACP methyl ester carboxylesterase
MIRRFGVGLVGVALVAALGVGPAAGASSEPGRGATAAPPTHIKVGSQTLTRCGQEYCGTFWVPLDYAHPSAGRIGIVYRWYPDGDGGQADGTVVPVEGGPGYPSIGSVAPDGYAAMYGPLLDRWNMLAVDLRGTGQSDDLVCHALQDFHGPSGTARFQAVAGACANALNAEVGRPGVQPSSLFTSAVAAQDLSGLISALALPPVDLYGDSYGSFFAQVFASRHPSQIRSVTLDSTYATRGLDPWYRSSIEGMPGDFNLVCARSQACSSATSGPAWNDIVALAARLRTSPITGVVPGDEGKDATVTMSVVGLVNLVSDSAEDPQIYRDLDAAARALLQDGDAAPLLRLYAQRLAVDEAYFGQPPQSYSVELYLAVSCLDYPQLFNMHDNPATRKAQLAAAVAKLPPSTFAPFTTAEWLAMDQNTEAYTVCLDWPAPQGATPPVTGPAPLLPAKMPVLILGGELDTWTPPGGIPQVQHLLGGQERVVIFANETHVVGEGDPYNCASVVIRNFVADPAQLDHINTSCAANIPAIHAVGVYPADLKQTPFLTPTGPAVPVRAGQLAVAAVDTAGDALARWNAISVTRDTGLYGGTVIALHGGASFELESDELVPGVRVSGTIAVHDGVATARLTAAAGAGPWIRLHASWPTGGVDAVATVNGSSHGLVVVGTTPAP